MQGDKKVLIILFIYTDQVDRMNRAEARWKSEHKMEIAAYNKWYRVNHPEKVKIARKRWFNEHKDYVKIFKHKYYLQRKEYYRKLRQKQAFNLKIEVFKHYSSDLKCPCGESRIECLQLDHIANNGSEDRKKFGLGNSLYRNLKKRNFPPGYQVLCANCNFYKKFHPNWNPLKGDPFP